MKEGEGFDMQADFEEKRDFFRVDHDAPLNFKVVKGDSFSHKSDIYARNVSASGLLFRTEKESSVPALSSIVWIELDPKIMNICHEIEDDLVTHNNGVFGRVVRIAEGEPNKSYDIGICFLRKKDISEQDMAILCET
ncbi:MAG: PilZ domain-containing protein [Candidatus Omnitrophica bacterium]|nr:PilZ domain-containing protein [Candidatus Omnitrophota bacterium]